MADPCRPSRPSRLRGRRAAPGAHPLRSRPDRGAGLWRQIAELLWGAERVAEEWWPGGWMHGRVKRRLANARAMSRAGRAGDGTEGILAGLLRTVPGNENRMAETRSNV